MKDFLLFVLSVGKFLISNIALNLKQLLEWSIKMEIGITEVTTLSEDEQIRLIGHRVVQYKEIVSFMVKDTPTADRYIQKLTYNFRMIRVIDRSQFTDGVMVRVGPPLGTMH